MVAEAGIALAVIGVVFLAIVGSFTICCLCCAVPVWFLFSRLFSRKGQKPTEYQMVEVSERRNEFLAPSAPLYDAASEPIAEAYLVPPLAAVHTENSEIVLGVPMDSTTPLQAKSEQAGNGFKDVWAALLFLGNVVFVVWFAVQAYSNAADSVSDASNSANNTAHTNLLALNTMVVSCVCLAVVASLIGSAWLSILMRYSETMIEMVMWTNIILLTVAAVGCLVVEQLWGALIFGLLAGLSYWFYISVKHRIPFASAVIRTACLAIKTHYTGLLTTSYGMMMVQVVWFILWSAASYGVWQLVQKNEGTTSNVSSDGHHHSGSSSNSGDGSGSSSSGNSDVKTWVTFGLLISLFWGAQVIRGIVQTTVCGTVACWWFQPNRSAPVRGSLFRAVTTSFGSICFGALIVAVIQAVKELLHHAREAALKRRSRDRNIALVCFIDIVEYLLGCIEAALVYFNTYAYCYVAAYGLDFMSSGKQVSALFQRRGWSAIINDSLISRTISMSVMALAVLSGLVGAAASQALVGTPYALGQTSQCLLVAGGSLGLLMGVAVAMVLVNTLESAVAMVFVSFAEDPTALQVNHSAEFENLVSKWRMTYPETIEWIATVSNRNYGHSGRSSNGGGGGGTGLYASTVSPVAAVPVAPYAGPGSVSYLGGTVSPSSYTYQPVVGSKSANPPPMNPMYREGKL